MALPYTRSSDLTSPFVSTGRMEHAMKISPPLLGHSKKNRTARLLGVLVVAIGFGAMAASAPAGGFSALIVSFSPSVALGAAEQDA